MSDWIEHEKGAAMPVDGESFVLTETVSPHFNLGMPRPAKDYSNTAIMGGNQWTGECHPDAQVLRYRVVHVPAAIKLRGSDQSE
jgi:hypothetical protein